MTAQQFSQEYQDQVEFLNQLVRQGALTWQQVHVILFQLNTCISSSSVQDSFVIVVDEV